MVHPKTHSMTNNKTLSPNEQIGKRNELLLRNLFSFCMLLRNWSCIVELGKSFYHNLWNFWNVGGTLQWWNNNNAFISCWYRNDSKTVEGSQPEKFAFYLNKNCQIQDIPSFMSYLNDPYCVSFPFNKVWNHSWSHYGSTQVICFWLVYIWGKLSPQIVQLLVSIGSSPSQK